jgi:very-short-patch-repair endonuclease
VITDDQLEGQLRFGRLEIVRQGIYRSVATPETWAQLLLAACLAGGPGAAASFRSAAWLWRLAGFDAPDQLEITVPRQRRARLPGVIVHDTVVRGRAHTMRHTGIPVTTPARTLCDLTACCLPWIVERAVDDALRRKLTTLTQLEKVFLDLANKGRRRSTVMRGILEARLPGFDPGGSEQEVKLVRWLVEAGLPRPKQQHRVRVGRRTYKLDLAYPSYKIAIEYDGWDTHSTRTSFDTDPVRDMDLEDEDWRVLHFTAKSSRRAVVERVRTAVHQRSK